MKKFIISLFYLETLDSNNEENKEGIELSIFYLLLKKIILIYLLLKKKKKILKYKNYLKLKNIIKSFN